MVIVSSLPTDSHMRLHGRPNRGGVISCKTLFLLLVTGCLCFYVGVIFGMHMAGGGSDGGMADNAVDAIIESRLAKEIEKITALHKESASSNRRFPESISKFAAGASTVNRDTFAKTFDTGVPLDKSERGNSEVLILYNSKNSMPKKSVKAITGGDSLPPALEVPTATENCDNLHIVLTDWNPKRKQCIAVMGQYEAFHIQKFMRLPETGKVDSKLPLRLVNRGAQQGGNKSTKPPTLEATKKYWETLRAYLSSLDGVLKELKPIAEKVAIRNTVIVMVCNHGQSELLMNFACSARARGLDTSHVLVFATDTETKELAEGVGLTAFYDEKNFAKMPSGSARAYLDRTFGAMMMAKVFCVQMVSMLGYDLLFQDVDVVWYRDPLEYFHDKDGPFYNFDIYFQDDGNHALYYAPYSANTGMYYMRSNERTRYFINSFLLAGDLIESTKSHQIALIAVLNEHASMYGLKVKIMSRDADEFPGGFHYHRRKPYMKELIAGTKKPYIFHMSWTNNKDNKLLFMKQLGMWYVEEKCIATTSDKIVAFDSPGGSGKLVSSCCTAEPKVTCHYRDKPSKIPCKDSPPIDAGRPSWW